MGGAGVHGGCVPREVWVSPETGQILPSVSLPPQCLHLVAAHTQAMLLLRARAEGVGVGEGEGEGVRVGPWRAGEGGGWAVRVWACTRGGRGKLAAARGAEGEGEAQGEAQGERLGRVQVGSCSG